MDAIRKRQIAEILDENKTSGNMVFALEKRWIQSETDNVLPYSQLNAEVLDSTTNTINSLFVLLEKKSAETFTTSIYTVHMLLPLLSSSLLSSFLLLWPGHVE
jgi:hypothetical protein